jgi:hypothetical protein
MDKENRKQKIQQETNKDNRKQINTTGNKEIQQETNKYNRKQIKTTGNK